MSVYYKEKPEYLSKSLASIFHQTYPASQIVLVKDGKLTNELDVEIAKWHKKLKDKLSIIELLADPNKEIV